MPHCVCVNDGVDDWSTSSLQLLTTSRYGQVIGSRAVEKLSNKYWMGQCRHISLEEITVR
jgi:hypothetical protein